MRLCTSARRLRLGLYMTGTAITSAHCLYKITHKKLRYPMNKTYFNTLQHLNLQRSRVKIPIMVVGECLHGVGSFKQSIFPQNIAVAASWDTDLAYRTARAIGKEARSIGIHGCFSPVLDLALDPRWGRVQGMFPTREVSNCPY